MTNPQTDPINLLLTRIYSLRLRDWTSLRVSELHISVLSDRRGRDVVEEEDYREKVKSHFGKSGRPVLKTLGVRK